MIPQITIVSGCRVWDDCFSCPYPDCVEETELGRRLRTEALWDRVRELDNVGRSRESIAQEMGKSRRTIDRYLGEKGG